MARPRPLLRASSLVVKKGSKSRAFTSSLIPQPLSLREIVTYSPAGRSVPVGSRSAAGPTSRVEVSIVRRPPLRIASRALTARFTNDLRELAGIDFDVGAFFQMMQVTNDRDVVAEEPEERTLEVGDEAVDLEHGGLERLATAEGEELVGERGGAAGGVADFLDLVGDLAFHSLLRQEQIAVAENGGEKIIEIVRDATGQLSERFHPLGAAGLRLQLATGGHVHQRPDQPDGCAAGVAQDQAALEDVGVGSVGALETVFAFPGFIGAVEGDTQAVLDAGQILGVNVVEPETDLFARGAAGVPEQTLQAARPEERAAAYIPIPNRIIRRTCNDFKIVRARCWISFKVRTVLLLSAGFIVVCVLFGQLPG